MKKITITCPEYEHEFSPDQSLEHQMDHLIQEVVLPLMQSLPKRENIGGIIKTTEVNRMSNKLKEAWKPSARSYAWSKAKRLKPSESSEAAKHPKNFTSFS